jgi:nanoRNase/pAp phosphatase (c-di-AMP/oligoRNAs hydrolase)
VRYILILDSPYFADYLHEHIAGFEDIVLLAKKDSAFFGPVLNYAKFCSENPLQSDTYRKLELTSNDRIIVQAEKEEKRDKILHAILSICEKVPIVVLHSAKQEIHPLNQTNVSFLPVNELFNKNISREWLYIKNREGTEKIRDLTRGAENILILTQHDPDPDALASGLALRSLLGRNRATAPIGSFGKVTRSENLRMIQLLDIRYNIIDPQTLNNYAMIAMVDVQPPYFGDKVVGADIVFDHHPPSAEYECSFKDIREHYGATSTLLAEYLIAQNTKLHQRLATALLYGIKTDTLELEREANPADIEAFTCLYPLANHNLIRQMENPSLTTQEITSYIRALKKQRLIEKVLFTHLGRVSKEDIIPRLADFCLQIEGAEWSVVSGLFQRNLVISIRNVGYVKSAAEIVRKVFSDTSIAGGHRAMAKAVISISAFKKAYQIAANNEIEDKIVELFLEAMREENG